MATSRHRDFCSIEDEDSDSHGIEQVSAERPVDEPLRSSYDDLFANFEPLCKNSPGMADHLQVPRALTFTAKRLMPGGALKSRTLLPAYSRRRLFGSVEFRAGSVHEQWSQRLPFGNSEPVRALHPESHTSVVGAHEEIS